MGQGHATPLPFRYGVEISSSTSILGPSIPARTREALVSHLASYNMWALQGTWCWGLGGGADAPGEVWGSVPHTPPSLGLGDSQGAMW